LQWWSVVRGTAVVS